jgi:hypothetical protein
MEFVNIYIINVLSIYNFFLFLLKGPWSYAVYSSHLQKEFHLCKHATQATTVSKTVHIKNIAQNPIMVHPKLALSIIGSSTFDTSVLLTKLHLYPLSE